MNTMLTRTLAFLMLAVAAAGCGDDSDGGSTTCRNEIVDVGEACDLVGGQLQFAPGGASTCAAATMGQMTGGVLGCSTTCQLDVSMCTGGGGGVGGTGG